MNLPSLPDIHAVAVLILTGIALFLFTREKISLETSSLLILVTLCVGFELFPYHSNNELLHAKDFFIGFGHEALVAVCALMIAGQALVRTGALEPIGRTLARVWRVRPALSLLLTMLIGAALSAFVNNTPIVVLMLPILVGVALKNKTSPSGTLMPMGLATLVGGMSTTIGTSTNLLVVSVAADLGVTFSMFDFVYPAIIAGTIAILYLWLIAPLLLPERQAPLADTSPRVFTAHIRVDQNAYASGKVLSKVIEKAGGSLKITRIQRGSNLSLSPLPDVVLQEGDMLRVEDTPENLQDYVKLVGGTLYSGDDPVDEEHPLAADNQQIAEVAIMAGSPLERVRISDARLASKYNLNVLAYHRAEQVAQIKSSELESRVLRAGDVLLVQSSAQNLAELKRKGELLVLDGTTELPRTKKAPLALLIMLGVVGLAAFGVLPIAISAVLGCVFLIITNCLSWQDATRALNIQVILIVVVSLALGMALMKTGGADYLAQLFIAITYKLPNSIILSSLILLMALLTNVVSNNAAAVIGTPIAINIAQRLGLPIEPFVLAVLFGANMSFATPMAYKTNLLVMNAGGYRFGDFFRVGLPLTFIMWLALSILLIFAYNL